MGNTHDAVVKFLTANDGYRMQFEKVFGAEPNIDNVGKAILDALNEIAYNDDGQVFMLTVEKWYVGPYDLIGTVLEVTQ
jgi:Holliday junction resolvase RusA-like endonuclease